MTDPHSRVMENSWNTAEVWPVPVECLLNGMNTPEMMFGGNQLLPPHFRHRFQSPVCLSTSHLNPSSGSINISCSSHAMVEGSQVSVDTSTGSSDQNDPEAHSISQPMTLDSGGKYNGDVLEESDEASDEDEEEDDEGEEDVSVPMSLVHEQQQHRQSVAMSHTIDNGSLVQCQQEALQVNSLQGDPMQQQPPMMSAMGQEQCQHQKSTLVNSAMTHAHNHNATNPSLTHAIPSQQITHPHQHSLSANPMVVNPISLPVQQSPAHFPSNPIPHDEDNSSQSNSDPNLGYNVQGKMYYEGRVVLHLKQLQNSFNGITGGFHNGFSSCAEAGLSKNSNLMGCAICRLRNPNSQNIQSHKEDHRHSVRGVLFTFEDCLIVELYPDHIPMNSNHLDPKPPPPLPPPSEKANHPMPISSYITSQPPETMNNGKRMLSHQTEHNMNHLPHVIVTEKHLQLQHPPQQQQHPPQPQQHPPPQPQQHPPQPQQHPSQQQQQHAPQQQQHPSQQHSHPQPHELQSSAEESSWWDEFDSEDDLKRNSENGSHHAGARNIGNEKLNHHLQNQESSLQQSHQQESTAQEGSSGHTNGGMIPHEILGPHSCLTNDNVNLGQSSQQIQAVQSIVPLELDLNTASNSGATSDESSQSGTGKLSGSQQCIGIHKNDCDGEEPLMVVDEVELSDKDQTSEVTNSSECEPKKSLGHTFPSGLNNAKKYGCPMCERSFNLKKMLKSHLNEVHHSGNPFRCVQCEAQFADDARLDKHSCTLSIHTLKSRERKLTLVSVFDNNTSTQRKFSTDENCDIKSKTSETREETDSEDGFEESAVSDTEDDNGSGRTMLQESASEVDEEDEDDFEDVESGSSAIKGSVRKTRFSLSNSEEKDKSELNFPNGMKSKEVYDDEDEDDENEDESDENENSHDENDYEAQVENRDDDVFQSVEDEDEAKEKPDEPPSKKKLVVKTSGTKRVISRGMTMRSSTKNLSSFKASKAINSCKKKSKAGGFNCGVCGKGFTVERRLENHKASHATERYSQCEKCGKRFARRDKLMRHMYVHSEEKMFVCDICQKRFSRRDKLSDHLKSHGTDEIHNCPMCQKQFLRPDILKQHVKLHGMGNKHQCPECLRFVTGKDRLEKHMARHEEAKAQGQTLLCPLCTKYFIQRQSLKAHIKKFHPEALVTLNLDQHVAQSGSSANSNSTTSQVGVGSSRGTSLSSLEGSNNNVPGALLVDEMMASKNATHKPRAFACESCSRVFVRKQALKKHMRKHPPNTRKIISEPSESQCSDRELESDQEINEATNNIDPLGDEGSSSAAMCQNQSAKSDHNVQSIMSHNNAQTPSDVKSCILPTLQSATSFSNSSCSSSNCSVTPPMSVIMSMQIPTPSPVQIVHPPPQPLSPPIHHQLSHGLTTISCNGGADIILSPVSQIPLSQSSSCALSSVSQANAQGLLTTTGSPMTHFAMTSHQHAAAVAAAHQHHLHHSHHHHMHSPHHPYSSAAAHHFLTAAAATICSAGSTSSNVVNTLQSSIPTPLSNQIHQDNDNSSTQLPPSPISHPQIGQIHSHLSQQLTVPMHHHVNVGMTASQAMCGSSYVLAAYPHYSYQ